MAETPPGATNDARIIQLMQQQDETGVQLLLDTHGERIAAKLESVFGWRYGVDIEQAVNDAVLIAWQRADKLDVRKGGLVNYVFAIARNNLIALLRRHAAGPVLELIELDDIDHSQGNGATTSEATMALLERLQHNINMLSDLQRAIVLNGLMENHGLTDEQLAARWDTTPKTIWSSRHKAHLKLRQLMGGEQ